MIDPAYSGYFADPFILSTGGGYVAYGGSGRPNESAREFAVLDSRDLVSWSSAGRALDVPDEFAGADFWAPEVFEAADGFWMYYSVGRGIEGHHIRVAHASSPVGPFEDQGVDLTPSEQFAIDPHPFRDDDGRLYLYFARDVLDGDRPGTHIAVMPMASPKWAARSAVPALRPNSDWQIYERARSMYGGVFDWHTLEGPGVVRRAGRYWMTYSGGAWTGPGYGVRWAVADHPLGPWQHATDDAGFLLQTDDDYTGPGHNSLVTAPNGRDVIAFHSWDVPRTTRSMHVRYISFGSEGPRIDGPIRGPSVVPASP